MKHFEVLEIKICEFDFVASDGIFVLNFLEISKRQFDEQVPFNMSLYTENIMYSGVGAIKLQA